MYTKINFISVYNGLILEPVNAHKEHSGRSVSLEFVGGGYEGNRRSAAQRREWASSNIQEAAQRLAISPLTLRAWIRQRRLPHVKLGRRVLLDSADVERFINANKVKAVSVDGKGFRCPAGKRPAVYS